MASKILKYPSLDLLKLTELPEGVEVSQFGHAYIARNWKLTPDVHRAVETAIQAGFTAMLQQGHPQTFRRRPSDRGVVYLTFSQFYEQPWVFVLDEDCSSDFARPHSFKLHKRFTSVLNELTIAGRPEWKSNKHLSVNIGYLGRVLEQIGSEL